MSALQIVSMPKAGRPCANVCMTATTGVRGATAFVTLLGYPMPGKDHRKGYFCALCVREFRKTWESALTGVPVELEEDCCACGCGAHVQSGNTFAPGHQHKTYDPEARKVAAPAVKKRQARVKRLTEAAA